MRYHTPIDPRRFLPVMLIIVFSLSYMTACQSTTPRQSTAPTLTGIVRDRDSGLALPEAQISVEEQRVRPDNDGRFELFLDRGTHRIEVSAPGYIAESFELCLEEAHQIYVRDIDLERRRLRGFIYDESNGQPISDAEVRHGTARSSSDKEGAFEIEARDSAPQISLFVSSAGYLPTELSADEIEARLSPSGALTTPLMISVAPRTLVGTIRESDTRETIPGVLVTMGDLTAHTDANGHYILRYIETGATVVFSHTNYQPHKDIAYTGQERQDAALAPWQVNVLVLDDETGQPLPHARVSARDVAELTDAQGTATLRLKPVTLTISADGYAPVTLSYGGESPLEARLKPVWVALRLRDKVTDAPVQDALVQVFSADSASPALMRPDSSGYLALENPLDVSRVLIKAPGYRRVTVPITRSGEIEIALEPFEARGIYIPFNYLYVPKTLESLLDLAQESELNAIVVDVKSDWGRIAWPSEVPLAQAIGSYQKNAADLARFVDDCHDRDLYVIARIVVFVDDWLALSRPEWAVVRESGEVYTDGLGLRWMDPFRQEVRDYNISLAVEIAEVGFDEIQFDYVRFPTHGGTKDLVYLQESSFETRTPAIAALFAQINAALSPTPAFVSADVYGLTPWVDPSRDMYMGQRFEDIAPYVDYISPMLYPATFAPDNLGFEHPVLHPYEVVYHSVLKAKARTPTKIRPWLQHYSGRGVTYGTAEYLKQMKGAEDAASCGWMFWHPRAWYAEEIFQPDAYSLLDEPASTPIEVESEESGEGTE